MEVETNFNIAEKLLKEMHGSGIQGNRLKLKTQETRAEDDRKFPVIQEPAWAEFRWQREYKIICSGGLFIPVSPQRTSTTCSGCGHISKENRKSQVQFAGVECGFSENADLVAAINKLSPLMRIRRDSLPPQTCFESSSCVLILADLGGKLRSNASWCPCAHY